MLLLHAGGSSLLEDGAWFCVTMVAAGVCTLLIGPGHARGAKARQMLCLAGALLALSVATSPPLDSVSDSLFVAHMLQHMLLLFIVAPLLTLSRVELLLLRVVPKGGPRRRTGRLLERAGRVLGPVPAWLILTATLWAWHLPLLFDAALANGGIHILEHASFITAGFLFCRAVFVERRRYHVTEPVAIGLVFVTMLNANVLGTLLSFSTSVWYSGYIAETHRNLSPLTDQHLAGLAMWLGGTPIFLATLLWLAYSWLREDERTAALNVDTMYTSRRSNESLS
ncbi:MAG TPA: cytochrome c oxidase assembly protein [Dehalococcoidia bacterium]|nr:cytochrome c oxidase assembly protein [Dehalococcoidia bacterium]